MARAKKTKNTNEEALKQSVAQDIDNVSPEVLENARKEMRKAMKERFGDWIEVSDETCDDAFIEEARKDFDAEVDVQKNRKFTLATYPDGLALKTAEFLKNFNEKYNKWEKGEWRGIIMFNKVIEQHIAELSLNPEKDFEIDYSTLIFLYRAMSNPSGIGLASAREMAVLENYDEVKDAPFEENIPVTYDGIFERVLGYVRELSVIDKKLKLYQERVNIAAAGVRFDFKITELEEFKQFHDAWVTDDVPTDPTELNKIANS